jgi:hypothetical protein
MSNRSATRCGEVKINPLAGREQQAAAVARHPLDPLADGAASSHRIWRDLGG